MKFPKTKHSNLFDASGNPIKYSIRNRYEASYHTGSRSVLPSSVQDAAKDLNTYDRERMAADARHLYQNSPLTRGLIQWLITYIVGTGIRPCPATEDVNFNNTAKRIFNQWSKVADLQSRNSFWVMQQIALMSTFLDGDIGIYLTRDQTNRPRLQLIESHNIRSNDRKIKAGYFNDGVQLDINGRPSAYEVRLKDGNYKTVDSNLFILQYIPERTCQYRGVTSLHAALHSIQDIEEICALEKQAVKLHSSLEGVIKLGQGDVFEEELIKDETHDPTVLDDQEWKARQKYYQETISTETKVLANGDSYESLASNRPSPAWQGFVSHILQSISLSLAIPPSVLLHSAATGPGVRRDLMAASRAFKRIQWRLAEQYQRIYEFVIYSEYVNRFIPSLPNDWKKTKWYYPKNITIDSGRDSRADIENLKMGLDTRERLYGEYGLDWQEEIKQLAKEEKFIKEIAEKNGLAPQDLTLKTAKQLEQKQDEEF